MTLHMYVIVGVLLCVYNDDSLQWFSFIIGSKEEMEKLDDMFINGTITPPCTVPSSQNCPLTDITNNHPVKPNTRNPSQHKGKVAALGVLQQI